MKFLRKKTKENLNKNDDKNANDSDADSDAEDKNEKVKLNKVDEKKDAIEEILNEGDTDDEEGDDDVNERVARFKNMKKDAKTLKKNCVYCQIEIPQTAVRCYSCHYDQPVDYLDTIQAKVTVEKTTKLYKIYKIALIDEENPEEGLIFSKYFFKVKDKFILSFLPSFATCNYIPKKKNQAYVKARSLIVNLPQIRAYIRTAQPHANFVNFINEVEKIKELNDQEIQVLLKRRKIVFDALYYIFESGAPVFGYKYREKLGSIIKTAKYSDGIFGDLFAVTGATIKSNGTAFFYHDENFNIPEFEGAMSLSDLPLLNLDRRSKHYLNERGKRFCELAKGHHYQQYSGAMTRNSTFGSIRYKADGRIMVDVVTHNQRNPNNTNFAYISNAYNGQSDPKILETIPDEELFITWPTLPGFSFACKQWGEFFVAQISEIHFDDKAFLRLVLPEEKKSLIRALVEDHRESIARLNEKKEEERLKEASNINHKVDEKPRDLTKSQRKQEFTDIITGKGGGCIFLLHGSPGVGKTLTAEAVSEHLHIPLYMITVGELGTTPQGLESSLQQILELASTWGASILLDEADIFLEKRSKKDIVRNAMVGIFLRLLEYHQGVLFLTTNRIKCLDEAFSSRISIGINYSELDRSARRQVWYNFLTMAVGDEDLGELDVDRLSEFILNGRQIRSCVRLGQALARTQNSPLKMEHLEVTINISLNFRDQFDEITKAGKKSAKKKSTADNSIIVD